MQARPGAGDASRQARADNSTQRRCADARRGALRGGHTADELRRFQDQQVAWQKAQQPLGGVADERTLESGTRYRARHDNIRAQAAGNLCHCRARFAPEQMTTGERYIAAPDECLQAELGARRVRLCRGGTDSRRERAGRGCRCLVGVYRVQRALERARDLRTESQYLLIEHRGLAERESGIYGADDGRATIRVRLLDEQYRQGTEAQQLPVGKSQQRLREVPSATTFCHQQIRATDERAAHDRLVCGVVPLRCDRDHWGVQPRTCRNPFESLEVTAALLVLQLLQSGHVRAEHSHVGRGIDGMKELELRTERARELRGLRHRRQYQGTGIPDGGENATDTVQD